MGDFEVLERDGLARIGRLATPHGPIDTPALLPVVHPDPARQPIPPREIRRRFGLGALITSSYITYRGPDLRTRAEEIGIHGLIDFDGPVMTDSGAFQQHAYGHIEVGPEEILAFQEKIGSDIATVLDIFVEPEADHEAALAGVETTELRARAARAARSGLLAVPVQGGRFADLRERSARSASGLGDVLAVGGVVPLFEQYRFADVADAVLAARPHLAPGGVVHLFGTGHPMTFAFAALLGVDLYDSSAYHKFARRGKLMFPEGTVEAESLREDVCRCTMCAEMPLSEVARLGTTEREVAYAAHNLLVSSEEMGRVRQAIRDGTLWELAERRATAHPALLAGLRRLKSSSGTFLATEPESRRTYRETGLSSFERPAAARFRTSLERYRGHGLRELPIRRMPLTPEFLERVPLTDESGEPLRWSCTTPFGSVPLELIEVYPVGPCLAEEEFAPSDAGGRSPRRTEEEVSRVLGRAYPGTSSRVEEWTAFQVRSLLALRYGSSIAESFLADGVRGDRSRRTGRLRWIRRGADTLFSIGNDGVPRPSWAGAVALAGRLPARRERVVVDTDAVEFVREGRSLFSRFAREADPALVPGASALLETPGGELIAVGRLLLAPHELGVLRRGVAARVTAHRHASADESDDAPDEL